MKAAAGLAITWFIFKLIMLSAGYEDERYGVMLNLLFLVLIVYASIRQAKKDEGFVSMVKAGMRPAAVYVLLISFFVFAYYKWIDPGYMANVVEENMSSLDQTIDKKGGFEAFKKDFPKIDASDKEGYLSEQRENMNTFFSPFSRASQSLLALVMTSLFYALLLTGIYRLSNRFMNR